ncbi:hypothetical protein, partial [uncultured Campylobacter sp.]|uniref:hypothetical protein n=1 Tax=uncultured Campylobacter sp. TaxID=218934 RepID=UPI002611ADE3
SKLGSARNGNVIIQERCLKGAEYAREILKNDLENFKFYNEILWLTRLAQISSPASVKIL